ncbi:hypothetical protein [Ralstonia phage BHDT8]|nr:hypothetical protein [Ralstonia phage BHDT8]
MYVLYVLYAYCTVYVLYMYFTVYVLYVYCMCTVYIYVRTMYIYMYIYCIFTVYLLYIYSMAEERIGLNCMLLSPRSHRSHRIGRRWLSACSVHGVGRTWHHLQRLLLPHSPEGCPRCGMPVRGPDSDTAFSVSQGNQNQPESPTLLPGSVLCI